MTLSEFVRNLWENSEDYTTRMDIETARQDLDNFRRSEFDMPEDITPESYMESWNELVTAYGSDMMDNMVQEFLIDRSNDEDEDPIILDGKPYFDDDTNEWAQEAHDSKSSFTLVARKDGNIYIAG